MDLQRIAAIVGREYTLDLDGLHGVWHWRRVWQNGRRLAERTPSADLAVIELFALLHDSQRWDDGRDPQHGKRAADFAKRLSEEGVLTVETAQLELLVEACAWHNSPRTSSDPTIGCCWDADRLELSRLSDPPNAKYLSTEAALDAEVQRLAWDAGYNGHKDRDGAERWGFVVF